MPLPRLIRSALGALALGACVRGAPPPVTPPVPAESFAIDTLGAAQVEQLAALLRLEDRREFQPLVLEAALGDSHVEVRRRAALAAGRIGDRRATPWLIAALGDSSVRVRADAAFALGELADTSAAVALAQLLEQRALPGAEDGAEAAHALGKLVTQTARHALERVLRDGVMHASTRSASGAGAWDPVAEALLALWKQPRQDATVALLTPYVLHAGHPELQRRAVYALMRLGDPRGVSQLQVALGSRDPLVRSLAARGLRAGVVDSAGLRATTVPALVRALDDAHAHVRINALRALGTYADSVLADPVVAWLQAGDANIAISAAEALGGLGGARAATALENLVADSAARLTLRGAALAALVRVDARRGLESAARLATATDWLTRLYAARAARGARWADAAPLLRLLAVDPDARVAGAAMETAESLSADTTVAIRAFYIQGLAAADPIVRAAALRSLARTARAAELPMLLDAYQRAQQDSILNDAALAAVAALGALARQGVPVARSFYLRFPRSADALVRLQVARQLGPGEWGEALPVETGREWAFYRGIVQELVLPALRGAPLPRVRIATPAGEIVLELAAADAPLTVHNLIRLAEAGFYDGGRWHRIVPNFVSQDGDPRGDGSGGPGYAIRDEMNRIRYLRGTLGMALSGPDTGGSQFFITHSVQPHLDGGYTVFGRVISGMDAVDRLVQDDPILSFNMLP